jgi:transposase
MKEVTTIGLDLAKNVFQVHGVDRAGAVVVRRALRRSQVLAWFAKLPRCLVGMEACATAHYWARELRKLGHEARLIPPAYAKAYVRRNKNDAADAAAICEAVSRPSMRFVTIKTDQQQAVAGIHRVRDLLIKQRTMLRNQLRGMMAEFGVVAAQGRRGLNELLAILSDPEDRCIPSPLREGLMAIMETLRGLERKLEAIDRQMVAAGRQDATYRHLVTAPGYGPVECHGGAGDRSRRLQAKLRLCRLARSGAASGRHRRQGEAWPDQQARQRLPAPAAGERRDIADQMPARQTRSLGSEAAHQQAAQGGGSRPGQQAGAHWLGVDEAPGGLPRPAGGLSGLTAADPEGLRG